MKVKITGKSEQTITFNKIGVVLRGKEVTYADIDTVEQQREISEIEGVNLIDVEAIDDDYDFSEDKRMVFRESVKESPADKMGSNVIVATGEGVRSGRMSHSAIPEIGESEATKESIEAMEKLEEEEAEAQERIENAEQLIDEDKLDPSEQAGRKAIISSRGETERVKMVSDITKEQGDKVRDPFIDKKEAKKEAIEETPKKKRGRPKGSKNKLKSSKIEEAKPSKPSKPSKLKEKEKPSKPSKPSKPKEVSPFVDADTQTSSDAFIEL